MLRAVVNTKLVGIGSNADGSGGVIESPPIQAIPSLSRVDETPESFNGLITGYDDDRPIIDSRYKLPASAGKPEIGEAFEWKDTGLKFERKSIRVVADELL
ncbi:MAG: hypothetical protein ACRESS_05250 [Stenotrophobium sp.]